MAVDRRRAALIALMLAPNLAALCFLVFVWAPQLRQRSIYKALTASQPPEFWWPRAWRRELRTSFLLDGSAMVEESTRTGDGGLAFGVGVLELETEVDRRLFRSTPMPSIKGGYSFGEQLLPVGPFRVRFLASDGRRSRWIRIPEIDPGRHFMNWRFTPE